MFLLAFKPCLILDNTFSLFFGEIGVRFDAFKSTQTTLGFLPRNGLKEGSNALDCFFIDMKANVGKMKININHLGQYLQKSVFTSAIVAGLASRVKIVNSSTLNATTIALMFLLSPVTILTSFVFKL